MTDAKRVRLVHIAKTRLGLTEEDYRAALRRVGSANSATELSDHGFRAMMDYFAMLGFKSDWRQRNLGDRPGMASAGQVATIRVLWRDYIGSDDEPALGRWLERSYSVSSVRFLDRASAGKAITGLKKMIARRAATAA